MYLPKELFSGNQAMATQIYKTTKAGVLDAPSGKTIAAEPLVIFNGEGERVNAGPAAKSYELA